MGYPRRISHQLCGYDYSADGCYYITVCTQGRQKILSELCRGGVLLRPIGRIVEEEIKCMEKRFEICINPYIIMPDHIHMIISIDRSIKRAEQSPAPTGIDGIMCAFKSLTTKIANRIDNCPGRKIWQRNYYDHIIRNEQDFIAVSDYIRNNPFIRYTDNEM